MTNQNYHRAGLEPKKSLGQNFMAEPGMLYKMADTAEIKPDEVVLEIGAGLGALTDVLAARAGRVIAVETDGRFIPELEARFLNQPNVEIVHADFLKANLGDLLGGDAARYKVVSNLPYYITTAIVRALLESPYPPTILVITVQYEVAERMVAAPPDMSLLAVSVQFYGAPRIIDRLKPAVFYPRPEVDSAIVSIEPSPSGPPLPPEETLRFFRIVRAGFSQARKKLRNSLAAGLRLRPDEISTWMQRADLDPSRRAETLSIADWLALVHEAPESS